ncbi:MAG TPA: prepilin peptidase [Candidatus Polarisedimenticolia bacterium]|nr:prepilin peptidase [Candidatus Polarisedimenticolia bacterium]
MPPVLIWILVAGAGACVGSFLNVCIHRLPLQRSIVHPRSSCPACGWQLAWYDNVPVVSWLALRGRCRQCASPISARYPLVEAATAALFLLLFLSRGATLSFFLHAYLAASLVALILIDRSHQLLPDAITLPGIAVGLLSSPFHGAAQRFLPAASLATAADACIAAALGFSILWAINAGYRGWQAVRGVPGPEREDGIGRGDFKLMAMIGSFLGIRLLLFSLFFGAISGALFGVYMLRFGGLGWKSRLPYGVFLGGAALLALFVGEPWVDWYLSSLGLAP